MAQSGTREIHEGLVSTAVMRAAGFTGDTLSVGLSPKLRRQLRRAGALATTTNLPDPYLTPGDERILDGVMDEMAAEARSAVGLRRERSVAEVDDITRYGAAELIAYEAMLVDAGSA